MPIFIHIEENWAESLQETDVDVVTQVIKRCH